MPSAPRSSGCRSAQEQQHQGHGRSTEDSRALAEEVWATTAEQVCAAATEQVWVAGEGRGVVGLGARQEFWDGGSIVLGYIVLNLKIQRERGGGHVRALQNHQWHYHRRRPHQQGLFCWRWTHQRQSRQHHCYKQKCLSGG